MFSSLSWKDGDEYIKKDMTEKQDPKPPVSSSRREDGPSCPPHNWEKLSRQHKSDIKKAQMWCCTNCPAKILSREKPAPDAES